MSLFRIINNKISALIKERPFLLEKELQKLTEGNLKAIFGLELVSSEFDLHGFRIDSVAFDKSTKSFVIIEYKKDRSFSVVDQGLSYLSLLLNNKGEFIVEYNENCMANLKREDIDWSQARVLFLARSFTNYQQNAINFRDLPIELWEVERYENNSILYNRVESEKTAASMKSLAQSKEIQRVSKEVKMYSEEDVILRGAKSEELYKKLKEKVLLIDSNLIPHATKLYLSFRFPNNWRNLIAIWFRKEKLIIDLLRSRPKDFKDPEKKVRYRKDSIKNYNQHISSVEVGTEKELEYAMYLIQQLYDQFVKE
ncbi:hypothetical protein HY504_02570 [Candidatus Wolfebacteria bacterium]|nr:hypothetical protein [Candidatus Wolfebacteria bacterium]